MVEGRGSWSQVDLRPSTFDPRPDQPLMTFDLCPTRRVKGRKGRLKFLCAAKIPVETCRVKVPVMGGGAREEQDRVATVSEGGANGERAIVTVTALAGRVDGHWVWTLDRVLDAGCWGVVSRHPQPSTQDLSSVQTLYPSPFTVRLLGIRIELSEYQYILSH